MAMWRCPASSANTLTPLLAKPVMKVRRAPYEVAASTPVTSYRIQKRIQWPLALKRRPPREVNSAFAVPCGSLSALIATHRAPVEHTQSMLQHRVQTQQMFERAGVGHNLTEQQAFHVEQIKADFKSTNVAHTLQTNFVRCYSFMLKL